MFLPDYRRRGWNRIRWTKALFLCMALLGIATPFALAKIPALQSVFDERPWVNTVFTIGTLFVSAALYCLLLRVTLWRWVTARERKSMASIKELTASPSAWQETQTPRSKKAEPQPGKLTRAVNLSPSDFEEEVAWVFARLFSLKPQRVGGKGDGGIDINLYNDRGTLVGIVQAKRYGANKTLNPSFLRELDSCKRRLGVRRAFLVTTAQFSAETRQQAKNMGIDLVDGRLFEEWRAKASKTQS